MLFPCIQTETAPVASAHACFGFNLLDRLSFQKPDFSVPEDAEFFSSVPALEAKIASQVDHNGATYGLVPGSYQIGSQIESDGRFNMTLTTDPNNSAVIDGQGSANTAFLVGNGNNVEVQNFEIVNMLNHGVMVGREFSEQGGDGNKIRNLKIHDCIRTGVTVRNRAVNTLIECNEIYAIGDPSDVAGGEAIYIGYGPSDGLDQYASETTVRGNILYSNFGEAIDVKRESRGVLIEYNDIFDNEVQSQGAITLGLDDRGSTADYDARYIVRYNCVRGTRTRAFNGNALVIAHAGTKVYENIMFDNAADVIAVYNDCDGPNKLVEIYNNILWGSNPVMENVGNAQNGPVNNCNIVRQSNIVQMNAAANECLETEAIFTGPLTNCAGFAPVA